MHILYMYLILVISVLFIVLALILLSISHTPVKTVTKKTASLDGLIPAATEGNYRYTGEGYFAIPPEQQTCGQECSRDSGFGFYFINELSEPITLQIDKSSIGKQSNGSTCEPSSSDLTVAVIPPNGEYFWSGESIQQAFSVPFAGTGINLVDQDKNRIAIVTDLTSRIQKNITSREKHTLRHFLILGVVKGASGFLLGRVSNVKGKKVAQVVETFVQT